MTKIVVGLADPHVREDVCSGLRLKRYDVSVHTPGEENETPKGLAARLIEEKADVAILDYVVEDAASVKMLQASTDLADLPRFIFVLPEGVSVSHILMAVNEGASALIELPVNIDALSNYVGRALSGPSRFRHEKDREDTLAANLADLEREAKALQMQMASNRKLISFLLSTPPAAQHRTALLVSDSAYQRDSLKKLLEDHGFHVHLAQNPEEGVATALEEKPRIVISDLEMEGKNGIEFCRDLKINHKFVPCFFVICTANREKVETVMAPGNGVDGCVIKPSTESDNQELIAAAAMGLLL
jgi:twitching motility two-component system response regulator PilH